MNVPTDHPSAQDLAAFAERRATGESSARILDHLTGCADCARIVLDLRGETREPDPESARAWTRFRQIAGRGPSSTPGPAVTRPALKGRWVLAAGIAVSLALLAAWVRAGLELREVSAQLDVARAELRTVRQPQVRVVTADALPLGALRGGGEAILEFGDEDRIGVLRLILIEEPATDLLRLTVLDPSGEPLRELSDLRLGEDGDVTLTLWRDWLPAAAYRLALGEMDSSGAPLAEYRLRIRK